MTYRKLAKLAGVSPSTVYKVFTGSPEISRETTDRIRQIAKEYGFTPIRYYKGGKNDLVKTRVAILVPEIISVYYSQIVTSMAQILGEYGIRPNIYLTGFTPKECSTVMQMLDDEGLTDGILTLSASEINEVPLIPIVQLFSENKNKYLDSVVLDVQSGFMEAMEYLKSLGHQSVGFIGENNTTQKQRYFKKSAEALGMTADPSHIFISDKRFEKIGFEGADYFLKQDKMPTAILTAYDEVALGAMQVFTQSGVRIPEDIS
ncbi:MAG: LacI family DNA-binding transcriptional regulator, partial [Eubacteriales bacterium]